MSEVRARTRTLEVSGGREVTIRTAVPGDAAGIIRIIEDVSQEGRLIAVDRVDMSRRAVARYLRAHDWGPSGTVWVAQAQAEVVGQLSVTRDRGIHHHIAEIGMSVAAGWRRGGIGTALIEEAIVWARTFEVEKLTLMVFPHNEPAIALYRKMGFVEEGLRRRHAKMSYGYEDLIEMSLLV